MTGGLIGRLLFCLIFITALIFSLALFSSKAKAATDITGPITGNVTWTSAGSPYILHGTVEVTAGSTLTIQSGVKVQGFNASAGLLVTGSLNASLGIIGSRSMRLTKS